MVREHRFEVSFPSCTPKEFFDAIYADEVSMKLYLKLNTVNGTFSVSPWKDSERVIEFTKEMQLPAAIAAITGSNFMPVKDIQKLTMGNNSEFTVSSTPEIQMSIGSYFKATTEVNVKHREKGCLAEIVIVCEAAGPWGMINLIESFMEEEAKTGVENYMTFCETRLADLRAEHCSTDESVDDQFYDVHYESLSQVSLSVSDVPKEGGMLTVESLIHMSLKRLEEEAKLTTENIQTVLKKMERMEASLARKQRMSYYALIGVSTLSISLIASLVFMKYHQS